MTTGGPEAPPPPGGSPQQQWAPPPSAPPPQAPGSDPAEVVGRRIGAALIDFLPLIVLFVVVGLAMGEGESSDGNASITLEGGSAVLYFLLTLAYYIATEAAWGATLGKRALGLVVARADGGGRPGFGQIAGRNLLRVVDAAPFLYLIGLIVMLATKRKQRVGDLAASTVVVRRQPAGTA
jgi:uncharacterized RDD family membrane protein YckC